MGIFSEAFFKLSPQKLELDKYILLEDEEISNGTIICKKCKTPRSVELEKDIIIKCLCKCQLEERAKQEKLEQDKKRFEYYMNLKKSSLLGKRFENADFKTVDLNRPQDFVNAYERCKKYCDNWEEIKTKGMGIYLWGNTGNGKTHLLSCIGNELMKKFVPVLFTSFIDISKDLRNIYDINKESEMSYINKLTDIDLLIIDDIGTEQIQKNGNDTFLQEKIYDIINLRYVNMKPVIYSSNYSIAELGTKCGLAKKTLERIAEMSAAKIELKDNSYRAILDKTNGLF